MLEGGAGAGEHAQPTIRRTGRDSETPGANLQAALDNWIRDLHSGRIESSARAAELARRAYAPIQRLLEEDAAAKAALIELRDLRIAGLEARLRSHGLAHTFGGVELVSLVPKLHAGVNVFAPPYDFQVNGPNAGQVTSSPNRMTGTFSVLLTWGHGGARFATAGVGLTLQAGATGVVHVRPAWQYDYQASADGQWLGAHTDGAGRLVFQDAVTGAVLKEIMAPLWNFNEDRWEQQNGFIDSWALGADLFVQSGQVFTVTFLATAMVDDSGTDHWFGWSLARAFMEMRVPFVVVELGS